MTSVNCTNDHECDTFLQRCNDGICECRENSINSNGICFTCPGYNEPCDAYGCCSEIYLTCIRGLCLCPNGTVTMTCNYLEPYTPIYITASQIALSAALIMGMAALSMVVYRLCTKPRYLSARQRALASQMGFNIENETLSYANYFRASLTSMQVRVLTRMRDRPPIYNNGPIPIALPEPPPPYERDPEGTALPPPYIEVVVSSTDGYTNTTFIENEPDGQINRSAVCPNCETITNQPTIDNCDKTKADESPGKKTETPDNSRIPM